MSSRCTYFFPGLLLKTFPLKNVFIRLEICTIKCHALISNIVSTHSLVCYLTSSSATRLSQRQIPRLMSENFMSCHIQTEQEDHDFCLSQSHYTNTDPTSRELPTELHVSRCFNPFKICSHCSSLLSFSFHHSRWHKMFQLLSTNYMAKKKGYFEFQVLKCQLFK